MGSSYSKLEKGKIKKYQSKTDRIFYNVVAVIVSAFLLIYSFFTFNEGQISKDTQAGLIPIIVFILLIILIILIWSDDYNNRKKKEQRTIDEAMDFTKFNFKTDEEYKLIFDSKIDEMRIVKQQIDKVTNTLYAAILKAPEELDFYEQNVDEFNQYDKDLKSFLVKHRVPMQYIMTHSFELGELFGQHGDNYKNTLQLVNGYNRVIDNRNMYLSYVNKFTSLINDRRKLFSHWNNLIEVVSKSREGIQISLDRIADLANLDSGLTETVLKLILEQNPEIGQYFDYEQSFIRGSGTDDILSSLKTKATKLSVDRSIESLQQCKKCDEYQSLLVRQCSNCGAELQSCQICKRGYRKDEKTASCIHCQNVFHHNHLLEIIKVSGKCPVCLKKLTVGEILK